MRFYFRSTIHTLVLNSKIQKNQKKIQFPKQFVQNFFEIEHKLFCAHLSTVQFSKITIEYFDLKRIE